MSLYQCEKCGCRENTACGWYWATKGAGPEYDMKLCSVCAPAKYSDGSSTGLGYWHGSFERKFYPIGTMETGPDGNLREKNLGAAEELTAEMIREKLENLPNISGQSIHFDGKEFKILKSEFPDEFDPHAESKHGPPFMGGFAKSVTDATSDTTFPITDIGSTSPSYEMRKLNRAERRSRKFRRATSTHKVLKQKRKHGNL